MRKTSIIYFCILLSISFSCTKSEVKEPEPVRLNRNANLLGAGSSANDILSNANFDTLQVEIGYVSGFRPTDASIIAFTDFLRQYTFKEDIEVTYLELPTPKKDKLTLQEVADLEVKHRTAYNKDSSLAIYIYFSDAASSEDDDDMGLVSLGAVYRNTSMVIYESTIRKLASQSMAISVTDVESATLNHEFGHLLGLVDLGSPAINDHEDENAPNHCNADSCLMRAELQFNNNRRKTNATNNLLDTPVCLLSGKTVLSLLSSKAAKNNALELDSNCALDLQMNGGR